MQRVSLAALVLLSLLRVPSGRAQDTGDLAAYEALTQTPPGAVVNPLGASVLGNRGGWGMHAQYGVRSLGEGYVHSVALGAVLKLGAGRVGLTAGTTLPDCDLVDCSGHFMAAISFGERLVAAAIGRPASAASLSVGIDVAGSVGTPKDTTLVAASASIPISLVPSTQGLRLVPFVAPGVGAGLAHRDGGTKGGVRALFGAGVGLLGLARGLAANAAVHRVFLRDGHWLVGVALAYTGAP